LSIRKIVAGLCGRVEEVVDIASKACRQRLRKVPKEQDAVRPALQLPMRPVPKLK